MIVNVSGRKPVSATVASQEVKVSRLTTLRWQQIYSVADAQYGRGSRQNCRLLHGVSRLARTRWSEATAVARDGFGRNSRRMREPGRREGRRESRSRCFLLFSCRFSVIARSPPRGGGKCARKDWRELGSVTTDDVVEQPEPFKGGAYWQDGGKWKMRKEDEQELVMNRE